ncbi:MAG TPA: VTT domain-containing protein [Cyclobacteriaceae bacterium]|nr:VTT domain-containing protein [Cyclobacteriaceae bacterium]
MLLYTFLDVFSPEEIIRFGGVTLLLLIVFCETGIFFGFFLPGDSLLFTAGLLTNHRILDVPVWELILLVTIAAVAGSTVGYMTGRWTHGYLSKRKENFFYKKEYMDMTRAFYRKYGAMAFIMGRFLPVVRTFVTIMSGMVRIDFKIFFIFNVIGVAIWVITMVLSGYMLGNIFPNILDYIEIIVIGMIVITAIPIILQFRKHRAANAAKSGPNK